jgi:hypothetical protein
MIKKNNLYKYRLPKYLSILAIKELLQSLSSDKVSRFSFSKNYLEKFIIFLKSQKLSYIVSDPVYMKFVDKKKNWANQSFDKYKRGLDKSYYIYFGKEKSKVTTAFHCEFKNDHNKLGTLLHIPKCCIKKFKSNLKILKKNNYDFIPQVIEDSRNINHPYNFYNNIFYQFEGYSLLSYAPCSFKCSASLIYGKESLTLIKMYNKKIFNNLKSKLILSCVYFKNYEPIFFSFQKVKQKLFKLKIKNLDFNFKKKFGPFRETYLEWENNNNFVFNNIKFQKYVKKKEGRVNLFI